MPETEEKIKIVGESVKIPALTNVTDQALIELEQRFKPENLPDPSTKEGYEFLRLGKAELVSLRTGAKNYKEGLVRDSIDWQKKVNTAHKGVITRIEAVEGPVAAKKKEHDDKVEEAKRLKKEAAAKRIANIKKAIKGIEDIPVSCVGLSSERLQGQIVTLKNIDIEANSKFYGEFMSDAKFALEVTIEKVSNMLETVKKQEEEAERLRVEKEAHEKQMKEDKAKRDKEEAEAQEERDRLAKEQAAKQAELDKKERDIEEKQKKLDDDRKAQEEAEIAKLKEVKILPPIHDLKNGPAEVLPPMKKHLVVQSAEEEERTTMAAEAYEDMSYLFGDADATIFYDALIGGKIRHVVVKWVENE